VKPPSAKAWLHPSRSISELSSAHVKSSTPETDRADAGPVFASVRAAALALDLSAAARTEAAGLLFVDAGGARLDRLARMARVFAPELEVLALPAWDSLPYDRTPLSPAVMGQRVHCLARLAEAPCQRRLLLTSARALLQRVPPPAHWTASMRRLAIGGELDQDRFRRDLASFGYQFDDYVEQPGAVALRGHVVDVFPGDAARPVRIELTEGRIAALFSFDPATQRSDTEIESFILRPVVEAEPEPEQVAQEIDRMSHPDAAAEQTAMQLSVDPSGLRESLLDYTPAISVLLHPDAADRWADVELQAKDAYEAARLASRTVRDGTSLPRPDRLYVSAESLTKRLEHAPVITGNPATAIPAPRDLRDLLRQIEAAGRATVIVAGEPARAVASALSRRGLKQVRVAPDWPDATNGPAGIACLSLRISEGFDRAGLRLIPAPATLGAARPAASAAGMPLEDALRISDIVVHGEHGICRLSGLRRVEEEERLALEFHEGTELLVPVTDLVQLWRYGSDAAHVVLDRLHGDAWQRRRGEIESRISETARALATAAARRANTKAPVIEPPAGAFGRVVDRFPFVPSADQQTAIDAVMADLKAGRPMDRLVCGDVGFGKTEVALRATAAVALAGYQVAIVAPTTVLARQHLDTFRKRFAGTGVRVEPLLRGPGGGQAKAVRSGLADGSIGIVVGTQAIASNRLRFARLGLVVIDEEQRFGDADKRKMTALRSGNGAVHAMVMTATPIPRTLQAAMVGLRDISVIATPPTGRQPTRSFVLPFEQSLVRQALTRERVRGGQSFVVAPRIKDLGPLAEKLADWVPDLSVAVAHGKLKPELLEDVVTGFAEGEGDVLLATNIIEAGLDIPRANTILITGPDRFGLAELHQMRGRVGRGERRGLAYLLTDPDRKLANSTVQRLHTLEALEGLGAGVGIAVADMDARGAGDLFGDVQAGHVQAIGTELYQHILAGELAGLEGKPPVPPAPELHMEVTGRIPEEYVPESNVRLELYRRLARLPDMTAADDFADEMADRFGEVPASFGRLIASARLRIWCEGNGVCRIDAGPKAVALGVADPAAARRLAAGLHGAEAKQDRVLLPVAIHDPVGRLAHVLELLSVTGASSW
jgi:transcription-repair coupling factor (superfamily II helicase)